MGTPLPLDRVTALALDPGASAVVRGQVTTSVDGSAFDAAMQWDGLSAGASRPGGLFDLAAGGLRVAQQHPDRHEYVLASTGAPAASCAAAGTASPCLVPRLATLAHERLRTQAELGATLTGGVELEGVVAPPVVPSETSHALAVTSGMVALVVLAQRVRLWLRRRAATALGRVRSAAREALRATRGDPSLQPVAVQIRAMVTRAEELEATRVACTKKLGRVDCAALDRKRVAYARSSAPEASEALAWLTAEQAEAARLDRDLGLSLVGLQRIESALRVVALRIREDRGTRARIAKGDPVDRAAAELHLRDEALEEADRAVGL